jgi:hypothetical protein
MGEMAMAKAQKRTDLPGRTLVKDQKGRTGVVVGSLLPPQDSEPVLVEFDDSLETEKVNWEELTIIGSLRIEFGVECAKCVFRSGRVCSRYWNSASTFVPIDGQRKPTRIYPYCQRI